MGEKDPLCEMDMAKSPQAQQMNFGYPLNALGLTSKPEQTTVSDNKMALQQPATAPTLTSPPDQLAMESSPTPADLDVVRQFMPMHSPGSLELVTKMFSAANTKAGGPLP